MADLVKISELPSGTLSANDLIPFVDVETGITKKSVLSGIVSVAVAGNDGDVQFNQGGVLGADPLFTWDFATQTLEIGNGTSTFTDIGSTGGIVATQVGGNAFYVPFEGQNTSAGTTASTDLILGNNLATDLTNFMDIGISSSDNADTLFTGFPAGGSYWFNASGEIGIATQSANAIRFFTGGTLIANESARLLAGALTLGLTGTTLGKLQLSGNTSGLITIQGAAAAGTWTLTLPADDGTSGQVLQTNGSGVTTWETPTGGTTCLTLMPLPAQLGVTYNDNALAAAANTVAYVGQIIVPFDITVNKLSVWMNSVTTAGTYDVTIYSEDGQTQVIAITTATSGAGTLVLTTAVSAVVVSPGIYWVMVNGNGTANGTLGGFTTGQGTTKLPFVVTSEPVMSGTLTITAGTPPATFTPSSVVAGTATPLIRLDN